MKKAREPRTAPPRCRTAAAARETWCRYESRFMGRILDTVVTLGPIPRCWLSHAPGCMFAATTLPKPVARMELRHLRYLVVIADTGAFVRAADQLRVAQPALTRQMHDLEKELGA